MLTAEQEAQMFEGIARSHPAFREYLSKELDQQHEALIKSVDGELLRRAQGNAQRLKALIDRLDAALARKRS